MHFSNYFRSLNAEQDDGRIFIYENTLIFEFISPSDSEKDKYETAIKRDIFNYLVACILIDTVKWRLLPEEEYEELNLANVPRFSINPCNYYILIKFKQPINYELIKSILSAKNFPGQILSPFISESYRCDILENAKILFMTKIMLESDLAKKQIQDEIFYIDEETNDKIEHSANTKAPNSSQPSEFVNSKNEQADDNENKYSNELILKFESGLKKIDDAKKEILLLKKELNSRIDELKKYELPSPTNLEEYMLKVNELYGDNGQVEKKKLELAIAYCTKIKNYENNCDLKEFEQKQEENDFGKFLLATQLDCNQELGEQKEKINSIAAQSFSFQLLLKNIDIVHKQQILVISSPINYYIMLNLMREHHHPEFDKYPLEYLERWLQVEEQIQNEETQNDESHPIEKKEKNNSKRIYTTLINGVSKLLPMVFFKQYFFENHAELDHKCYDKKNLK